MRLRLSPRETSFYDMFSAAANNLVVTGELLAELVADGPDRVVLAGKIRDAEHVGDDITHRILRQLNSDVRDAVRPGGHLPAGQPSR